MTTTVIFVILSICTTLKGTTAKIKYVGGNEIHQKIISNPPKDWMVGDTIEIVKTEYMDGKEIVIKQDTTIIRWIEE